MKVKPIPKQVLIHTATYEEFVQGDGFETEDDFKSPVLLSNVLLQPSNTSTPNIIRTTTGEELQVNYTMFYDLVNSSANGEFDFTEKSRITFEGKTFIVEK